MSVSQAVPGAIAFALTVALVPAVKSLCVRWRLLDQPGPLKIHTRPVPRLGGVAVAVAIVAAVLLSSPHRGLLSWPFFVALSLVWTTGLLDDLRGLSPILRLAAQFAAGALLWLGNPRFASFAGGALGLLSVCGSVVVFVNSLNFLDGSDGIAAGVVAIISAAYLILPGAFGDPFALAVAWSVLGACAAFLFYNWPRASVHLGDSGSTVLGFVLAFLALEFVRSSSAAHAALLFPFLVAGLPLLDAGLAIIRRLRAGGSIFQGDRGHLYDLLLARGWPARRVALACYGITAVLGAAGLIGVRGDALKFCTLCSLSAAILLIVGIRLGSLRGNQRYRLVDGSPAPSLEAECGASSRPR